MSIHLMNEVWRNAPFKGTVLLVLLSLADQANENGECWPSTSHIASRARCSARYVSEVLVELEQAGWLAREMRKGRSTLYKVLTPEPRFMGSTSTPEPQFTPEQSSPPNPSSGVGPEPPNPSSGVEPDLTPEPQFRGEPQFGGTPEPQFGGPLNPSSPESPRTTTTTTTAVEGEFLEDEPHEPEATEDRQPLQILPRRWNPDEAYIRMAIDTCPLVDLKAHLSRYILDRVEKGKKCSSEEWYRWVTADQQRAIERQTERDHRTTYARVYNVAE